MKYLWRLYYCFKPLKYNYPDKSAIVIKYCRVNGISYVNIPMSGGTRRQHELP